VVNLDSVQTPSFSPPKSCSSGIIAYRSFADIDELAAFLPEEIRLIQLSDQPFSCDSVALAFKTIQFSFNHVNGRLHAIGEKYSGFLTFTFLLRGQGQPVISNHRPLTDDYIWGFNANREADLVFPGNSTHCAIHIQKNVFEACTQAMDRPDLNAKFLEANYVYVPETLSFLKAYLNQLYELLSQKAPVLRKPGFQQLILQDFLPLLITALPVQQKQTPVKAFRRAQLVKQASDYMQSHMDQVLTLTDLCHSLGASSRALCYGFQEMFGMSPMAYLKLLRLQGVYRTLKATESSHRTVTEVATQFGFYHLGYFARDYKQVFGELPSETLKRIK
jgi:AraC family transcriptional regulator, ethanolamine operon transcriptional activator